MAIDPPGDGTDAAATSGLLPAEHLLNIWLSPAFPVGAYAYSHGLERAVEAGLLEGRAGLQDWLEDLVRQGSVWNDQVLAAVTMRATAAQEWPLLVEAAELGLALQPSSERLLETTQQGGSFLDQVQAAWPAPRLAGAVAVLRQRDLAEPIAYPIAFGMAASAHSVPERTALTALGLAFAGNLVSAAIRLSVIGQTDGQRVIAALAGLISERAEHAAVATLAELGSAVFLSDLMSIEHETQQTRLFRS
jgi:urease accessory protein